MKIIYSIILLLFILISFTFSQEKQQTESQKEIILRQLDKLNEAINSADKFVEHNRKSAKNKVSHAISLENVSILRKERIILMKRHIYNISNKEFANFYKTLKEDLKITENSLREALDIHTQINNGESLATASLKVELAWILLNPLFVLSDEEGKKLLNKAEKLYLEALATQEKLLGSNSELALRTMLILGDFYVTLVDFENALLFYERFLSEGEKKYGLNHVKLVPALRGIGKILVNTDSEVEAAEIAKRVSSITGKSEKYFPTNLNLLNRASKIKAVKYKQPDPFEDENSPGITTLGRFDEPLLVRRPFRSFLKIVVNILVDEKGNVIETKILGETEKKKEIEEAVRNMKFRPFVYKGVARKMRGSVSYTFIK